PAGQRVTELMEQHADEKQCRPPRRPQLVIAAENLKHDQQYERDMHPYPDVEDCPDGERPVNRAEHAIDTAPVTGAAPSFAVVIAVFPTHLTALRRTP